MMRRRNTKERQFTNRRTVQGSVASALPWVLSIAALALFIFVAVARGEEPRILTAEIIAVEGNPLTDHSALQKVKFVMKAGRPVDRNTL